MKQRIPVLRIEDCNYILFSEFWPEDSEGTFRSSSQAATCPPVYHTRWRFHTVPLQCWTSSREAMNTNFSSLRFDPTGNRTRNYDFRSRRSIYSTTDCFRLSAILLHYDCTGKRNPLSSCSTAFKPVVFKSKNLQRETFKLWRHVVSILKQHGNWIASLKKHRKLIKTLALKALE